MLVKATECILFYMEQTTRFGDRLRNRRREVGLTAGRLASVVGITENAIRKLEAGDSAEPRFSTGMKIAAALSIAPAELSGGSGATGGSPELAHVIRAIRSIQETLEQQGVEHVDIFGSVARGDAEPTSDVDVIVTPKASARFTLLNLGAVADMLEERLSRHVDTLTQRAVENTPHMRQAQREAVRAF
jgi:predicted nucleotidyltransferase